MLAAKQPKTSQAIRHQRRTHTSARMKEDGCKKDPGRAAAELFVCAMAESAHTAAKGSLVLWDT